MRISKGEHILLDGELVQVWMVEETDEGFDCAVRTKTGDLQSAFVPIADVAAYKVAPVDGEGSSASALVAVWARWMQWASPRIRSAVTATRPLMPLAHQDEAVFDAMLPQPRVRFLLADEPGTGKTIMSGMYLVEGRRIGLVPGKTVIVVPAHLIEKWIRDLRRYFGVDAMRLTREMGREPQGLRPDVRVWVVSVDLYTRNDDVRRAVAGPEASWSLAIFDEAHRLTPTSQYHAAAQQLAAISHHLLLLTATPHRGNEDYFRALLHLVDPTMYQWQSDAAADYGSELLKPADLNFIRRMKEDLLDEKRTPLFPARYATTISVRLTPPEQAAYDAVMEYVDDWYDANSVLARSIYGKRAASSVTAALFTLRRRLDALNGNGSTSSPLAPTGFEAGSLSAADVADDEAWELAENTILEARSRDRRAETAAVEAVIQRLEAAVEEVDSPAKWTHASEIFVRHNVVPGSEGAQLLVFTEFKDTARWLTEVFSKAGFVTERLDGDTDLVERDALQQRFLTRDFQVLISTDAGGEGIDLQSAHVMLNWDIPWSLVRLEQRMGRLHRIGQQADVHIYHLVAPTTREGRVQERMLENISAVGDSLDGRIFDLLDATFSDGTLNFNYAQALAEAQLSEGAADRARDDVPQVKDLEDRLGELRFREEALRSVPDVQRAAERFADDRLEAINPVIVDAFVDQVAGAEQWDIGAGPFPGIRRLQASPGSLEWVDEDGRALFTSNGRALEKARAGYFRRASEVVLLGPTEETFKDLVAAARHRHEPHLMQGATVVDAASLTDYTIFLFTGDIEHHDGVKRTRRPASVLVRCSGGGTFVVGWESIMNLAPATKSDRLPAPRPAVKLDAETVARAAVKEEASRLRSQKAHVANRYRSDLDSVGNSYRRQTRSMPPEVRRVLLERFEFDKAERLAQLESVKTVREVPPRLIGWLQVRGMAKSEDLTYDPSSERPAIATVLAELEGGGWYVDDRQTAYLGYDLFARHPETKEQRLVEVKGQLGNLSDVYLEPNEWVQAQQRGRDYWLYVVTNCSTHPRVTVRVQDPANELVGKNVTVARQRIPVGHLRRLMET